MKPKRTALMITAIVALFAMTMAATAKMAGPIPDQLAYATVVVIDQNVTATVSPPTSQAVITQQNAITPNVTLALIICDETGPTTPPGYLSSSKPLSVHAGIDDSPVFRKEVVPTTARNGTSAIPPAILSGNLFLSYMTTRATFVSSTGTSNVLRC